MLKQFKSLQVIKSIYRTQYHFTTGKQYQAFYHNILRYMIQFIFVGKINQLSSAVLSFQLYLSSSMRSNIHKQKFNLAFKQTTTIENQIPLSNAKKKAVDQPSVSIINFYSYKKEDAKRERQARKINPLATFSVPHTKHQSKVLRLFIESNKMNSLNQELAARFKSLRTRNCSLDSKRQYSQRLQPQARLHIANHQVQSEKVDQMGKNGNKSELESLNAKSENNIIESINTLRKKQTIISCPEEYSPQNQSFTVQNKLAKTSQTIFEETKASQLIENYKRWKKQDALYQLRLQIKNKLSRRHMHHVLKQKQQAQNRVPVRIRSLSNDYQIAQLPSYIKTEKRQSLYGRQTKSKVKSLQVKNIKNYTTPSYSEVASQLKVESKTAQIVCDILRCKEEYMKKCLNKIQKNFQMANHNNTANAFYRPAANLVEHSVGYQLMQQELRMKERASPDRKYRNRPTKELGGASASEQVPNIFRQLTPWHNNLDE